MKTRTLWTLAILAIVIVFFGSSVTADDTLTPEIKEKIQAFRAERQAIRTELKALRDANPGANREEMRTVFQEWKAQNQDRLNAQRDRAIAIRDLRRQQVNPEELKEKIAAFKSERRAIRSELRELRDDNLSASREEKQTILQNWKSQNESRIQEQKDRAMEIRSSLKRNFKMALVTKMKQRQFFRKQLKRKLANMTPEQRAEAIEIIKSRIQERRQ